MKGERKVRKKYSIRFKLVVYFSVFAALILLLLFLFQTVFLDMFYQQMKINTVKKAAQSVASVLDTEELADIMDSWAMQESLTIRVVMQDGTQTHSTFRPQTDQLTKADLQRLYEETIENDGTLLTTIRIKNDAEKKDKPKEDSSKEAPKTPSQPDGQSAPNEQPKPSDRSYQPRQDTFSETMRYSYIADSQTGTSRMIVVTTLLSPIDATVRTLQTQLLWASVILIIASVLLGLIVSRRIARPIVEINRSAKTLASGSYQSAKAGGYKEIEELRTTLDETAVELAKSEQLQRELLANISHDLRTPLTMITGYSEAIRDLPGENSAENIQVVIDEAERLTRLVNDVLDLSKLQSGTQQLHFERVDLTRTVKETVTRCERMTEKDGYCILFEAEEDAWVMADALRISQVIYNLLANALTYTGEDKQVTVTQQISDKAVRIAFTDSGKGIPPDQLDHIWERYYRVEREHRRSDLGSGLGLSIVHSIVGQHGGLCGAESREGQGSTFWFELPPAGNDADKKDR